MMRWILVVAACSPGLPASAEDLLQYSDFGRADILLTAASIRQSGDSQIARIDQTLDISGTDRSLYPTGSGNIADILQDGSSNQAYATQSGNLNRLRIEQRGSNNYVSSTQIGVGNTLDVTQTGLANTLLANQTGTGNSIVLTQAGGNSAILTETGDRNAINVQQIVGGPNISMNLVGSGLTVTIKQ
jgi:hypothetical protein